MAFLGPDGPPPPELWTSFEAVLADLSRGSEPEPLNVFDLMLAFGCGWARQVDPGGGWHGSKQGMTEPPDEPARGQTIWVPSTQGCWMVWSNSRRCQPTKPPT